MGWLVAHHCQPTSLANTQQVLTKAPPIDFSLVQARIWSVQTKLQCNCNTLRVANIPQTILTNDLIPGQSEKKAGLPLHWISNAAKKATAETECIDDFQPWIVIMDVFNRGQINYRRVQYVRTVTSEEDNGEFCMIDRCIRLFSRVCPASDPRLVI